MSPVHGREIEEMILYSTVGTSDMERAIKIMNVVPRLIRAIFLVAFVLVVAPSNSAELTEAEAVVQADVDTYNAHDVHAFMGTYAKDAEIYGFPAKLLLKGEAQIADFYRNKRFNDPRLHATIAKRIVVGDVIVDHEQIVITFPEGPGRLEAIAINEVRDGKMQKVALIRGKKVLDSSQ